MRFLLLSILFAILFAGAALAQNTDIGVLGGLSGPSGQVPDHGLGQSLACLAVAAGVGRDRGEAVIVSACRTPVGRYAGALASVRPDDLAALVVAEAVRRAGCAGQPQVLVRP